MSLRLYAYLLRIRYVLQLAAMSMAFGCLPFGFDLAWTLALVASVVAAPCCATFVLTGQFAFGMGDEDDGVTTDEEQVSATHGSRAPVRLSRLVEVGIVSFGLYEDTLYFLRASDGAWCAFSIEQAGPPLLSRLRELPGFAPSGRGRDIDGFAYWWLWRAADAA